MNEGVLLIYQMMPNILGLLGLVPPLRAFQTVAVLVDLCHVNGCIQQ
jgi:hypothetical protein